MTTVAPRPNLTPAAPEPAPPLGGISDDELTALALAADPAAVPAGVPDTLCLDGGGRAGLLPAAYMPAPMPGAHPGWFRVVALILAVAFLTITAAGFCITYGALSFA